MAGRRSLTRALLEALWRWSCDEGAEADVAAVRRLLLDHVAVAAWGSTIEAGRIMREHVLGDLPSGGPSLPVAGAGVRAPAVAASMANAVAAACYEFDDSHTGASLHPGAVVFPAAMAAAALAGCDERTFVRAVVIGYEVMCRVGLAARAEAHRARHFHPTSTAGHFGAAAAAAACLGLDVDGALAAVSLAGTVAGGSMQFLPEGAWTKQLHPALAVQRGVEAALLARRGFPGLEDPIAGARGFLAAQSAGPRPELLLDGLGRRPREVRSTGVKPYPSCRNTQAPLDALLEARREGALGPGDVVSVRFGLVRAGIATVWEPPDVKRRPRSLVDAQFSMPYVAAVALADGRVTTAQFTPARIGDERLRPLMDAVECVGDPALDARYPAALPAWVEVRTVDGRIVRAAVDNPSGDPASPLPDGRLREKYDELAAAAYGHERRAAIASAIGALPEPGSLAALVEALA